MPTKWNDPKRGEDVLRPEVANRGGDNKHCHLCGAIRIDNQIGLEQTPQEYVDNLVQVFRECWRILKDDGTLWLNLGDSYAGNMSRASNNGRAGFGNPREGVFNRGGEGIKDKDLIGIPWMVAFALRVDGWYLRQDIIWSKPNPMPSSVKDRCTTAHEYIFLLSKSSKYYYDYKAIAEPSTESSIKRYKHKAANKFDSNLKTNKHQYSMSADAQATLFNKTNSIIAQREIPMRNKRSIWTVTTKSYKGAHFATYPPKLIEPCILAGCPKGGIVFDPFVGSGTTVAVANSLGRMGIGIDLNYNYLLLAQERIKKVQFPLLLV